MPLPSHHFRFFYAINVWGIVQIKKLIITSFLQLINLCIKVAVTQHFQYIVKVHSELSPEQVKCELLSLIAAVFHFCIEDVSSGPVIHQNFHVCCSCYEV